MNTVGRLFFPILIVFQLSIPVCLYSQPKHICLSMDDLPMVNYGVTDSVFLTALFDRLLVTLKANDIPAVGFVNGNRLYDDGRFLIYRMGWLNRWASQGMELGNHTFSHPDYHKSSMEDFTADLLKNEPILKKILGDHGQSLHYFRHPYLHTGMSRERTDSLDRFLVSHGYQTAPVTVDNGDYLFAKAYHLAFKAGDTALMRKTRNDHLTSLEQKLQLSEEKSQALFGRQIPQILLIHANMLNADCLDDLIAVIRRNGYGFVTMDEALKDPAYQTSITIFSARGISWLDRWALTLGISGGPFRQVPEKDNK
jgi:peptidoglycan/xylan/chitin deacetylase (PgdA/CDA1 family)